MKDFTASFDGEELHNIVNNCFKVKYSASLKIPQFRNDYEISLREFLIQNGWSNVFTNPDFTNMYEGNISIEAIIHKTFIDINNKGTSAAASTAVIGLDSACQDDYINCSHPFLYMIYDKKADCPMFIGTVDQFDE